MNLTKEQLVALHAWNMDHPGLVSKILDYLIGVEEKNDAVSSIRWPTNLDFKIGPGLHPPGETGPVPTVDPRYPGLRIGSPVGKDVMACGSDSDTLLNHKISTGFGPIGGSGVGISN